jgi:hypothetical protein
MAELTPLQIVRNMAKDIIFKRNKGAPQFEKEPLEFRKVDVEKDPKLVALEDEIVQKNQENLRTFDPDPTFLPLERYESDSAGKQIADAFGMRVPGVSLFANAAKAYGHGIAMNKHREFIKNYVKEKMVKEGYTVDSYGNLNTEEARNELRKRMPEITDSNAFREFSEGALAAIPLARPVGKTLGALYKFFSNEAPYVTTTDAATMSIDELTSQIVADDTGQMKILEKEKGDNKKLLELAKSIGQVYMNNTSKTERPFVNDENVFE